MSAATPLPNDSRSSRLVELTMRAFELAASSAGKAADAMGGAKLTLLASINTDEEELDRIDQEMDDAVVYAITESAVREAGQMLTCMKCVIDLERIGDLLVSFASRASAVFPRISEDDRQDFVRIATLLEQMIENSRTAFRERDINRAINVLKMDNEIDRLRNLIFIRHVEGNDGGTPATPGSIQVLFMAQALERAGDHAKNLAEEVCHFVSGRTVRHLIRSSEKSYEQLFIDWLREKNKASF
jgi:phosphate transport system protein